MKKLSLKLCVTAGFAALLLGALMAWGGVSPQEVIATIRRLPPGVYAAALALHATTYCIRALRFRILIPRRSRPGFRRMLVVAAAHNMASYILPAKTGEAAYPLYLRVQCGVPTSAGLASLLVSRFLDGAMLCTGLAVACLWLRASGRYPYLHWLGLVGSALVAGSALFLVLSIRGDLLVRLLGQLLRWLRVHHWSLGERLILKTNSFAAALRASGDAGRLWLAMLATVPQWFTVFGFYTVLARAMGMPARISLLETSFGASLAGISNLLPLNGFAGVGTQEIGWVTGFNQFLGVPYELALRVGVGVHLIQILNIVAFGIVAHLAMGAMPRLVLRTVPGAPDEGSPAARNPREE